SVHRADWPEPLGVEADLDAGETAMAVVGALRKYKTDNQLSLNAPVERVEVFGNVDGFEEDVAGVMHVRELESLDREPEIESVVTGIDLDYSTVGPEYGNRVGEIDAGIEAGDYEIDGEVLRVAGVELDPEMFEVERERRYLGEGEMLEAGDAVVVVQN
ncbi:valine--tRNA ligase, partial [Halobium palmae]